MKQTAWDDLPNAKHIDRILTDLKKNPNRWSAAWTDARTAAWNAAMTDARDAAWNAARTAAWNAARTAAYSDASDAERYAALNAARDAARDAAFYTAWGAILALITYDDCAYLLDEKPEHVQILALLGNQAAILLYPACVALQKEMA